MLKACIGAVVAFGISITAAAEVEPKKKDLVYQVIEVISGKSDTVTVNVRELLDAAITGNFPKDISKLNNRIINELDQVVSIESGKATLHLDKLPGGIRSIPVIKEVEAILKKAVNENVDLIPALLNGKLNSVTVNLDDMIKQYENSPVIQRTLKKVLGDIDLDGNMLRMSLMLVAVNTDFISVNSGKLTFNGKAISKKLKSVPEFKEVAAILSKGMSQEDLKKIPDLLKGKSHSVTLDLNSMAAQYKNSPALKARIDKVKDFLVNNLLKEILPVIAGTSDSITINVRKLF